MHELEKNKGKNKYLQCNSKKTSGSSYNMRTAQSLPIMLKSIWAYSLEIRTLYILDLR